MGRFRRKKHVEDALEKSKGMSKRRILTKLDRYLKTDEGKVRYLERISSKRHKKLLSPMTLGSIQEIMGDHHLRMYKDSGERSPGYINPEFFPEEAAEFYGTAAEFYEKAGDTKIAKGVRERRKGVLINVAKRELSHLPSFALWHIMTTPPGKIEEVDRYRKEFDTILGLFKRSGLNREEYIGIIGKFFLKSGESASRNKESAEKLLKLTKDERHRIPWAQSVLATHNLLERYEKRGDDIACLDKASQLYQKLPKTTETRRDYFRRAKETEKSLGEKNLNWGNSWINTIKDFQNAGLKAERVYERVLGNAIKNDMYKAIYLVLDYARMNGIHSQKLSEMGVKAATAKENEKDYVSAARIYALIDFNPVEAREKERIADVYERGGFIKKAMELRKKAMK